MYPVCMGGGVHYFHFELCEQLLLTVLVVGQSTACSAICLYEAFPSLLLLTETLLVF